MVKLNEPLEDDENPCYCPDLPAAVYLDALRSRLDGLAFSEEDLDNPSFASLLYKSAEEEGLLHLGLVGTDIYEDEDEDSSLGSLHHVPEALKHEDFLDGSLIALIKYPSVKDGHGPPGMSMKRKWQMVSDSFSDLQGPVKRERSLQIVNQSSFDVSDKVEQLVFPSKNATSEEDALGEQDDTLVDISVRLQSLEGSLGPLLATVLNSYVQTGEKMNCMVLILAKRFRAT
ncbi:hypothetical protein OE88DRAFT_331947 [Heliocybe sulcata]|uniref:Uncharacterized protein n=1 Tax=Heliocybe sulcata TaxID=5364 RepID=A0A5C3N153_9AGAM|nr:hypothetical protein OE88DRAFT_331947 [Heliocybe sulcata]